MDLAFTTEEEAFRQEVRAWVRANLRGYFVAGYTPFRPDGEMDEAPMLYIGEIVGNGNGSSLGVDNPYRTNTDSWSLFGQTPPGWARVQAITENG